ncbi:hypothetical protein CLU79DRAFT_840620 [Phycomyces nitens]|nr:hypothetical protein CLU79DRAFT_840620 [Phycomyces nitens]
MHLHYESVSLISRSSSSFLASPARRNRKQTNKPKPLSSDVESSDGGSVTRCVCGEQHNLGLMVQCESCEVWQHCDCIGLGENDLPDHYYCDQCQPMQHNAPKPHGRSKRSYSLSSTNDPDTCKPEAPAESRPKRQKRVNTPPTPTLTSNSTSTATSTSNAPTPTPTSRRSSRRASTSSDQALDSPLALSMSEMIQDNGVQVLLFDQVLPPQSNDTERQTRSRKSARTEEGGPEEKMLDLPPTCRKRKPVQDPTVPVRKRSSISSATSTAPCDDKPKQTATGRQRKTRKLSQTEIPVEVAAYWDANGRPVRATTPPAKTKKPSPKMSFVDMNKRVSSILAYITKKEQEAQLPVASKDPKECHTKTKKTKKTKTPKSNFASQGESLAVLTHTLQSASFDSLPSTSPSSLPELSASSTCSDPSSIASGQSIPTLSPREVMGLLARENDSSEYHDSRRHSTSSSSTLSSESTIPFMNDPEDNVCYLDVHTKDSLLECSCLIHPAMYPTHICPAHSNNITSIPASNQMAHLHLDTQAFELPKTVPESSCDIMRRVRGLIDKFQRTYTGYI